MKFINRKKHIVLAGLLLAAATANLAHADLLLQYDINSTSTPLAPSTIGAGINSASSITFGGFAGAWTEPAGTGMLQYGPGSANSAALAIASGNYATFSLTSIAPMSLTSLTLDGGYGSFANPAGYALKSSVDGFSAIVSTANFATQSPTLTTQTIDLSGASFQGLSSISFRVYGYANNSGNIQFDNFTLNGAVVVPEPNTLAFAGMGMIGMLGLMASRRRK